jgi:hypothetical protein
MGSKLKSFVLMPAFARLWLLADCSLPEIVLIFLHVEVSSEKLKAISLKLVPISFSAR